MVALLLALLVAYAWWAPQSWMGRAMALCGARLAGWLASIRPGTFFGFVALAAAAGALVVYGKLDGLVMVGLAAPDVLAMLFAVDLGVAVEVVAIAWLAAGRGVLRTARDHIRATMRMVRRYFGTKRSTRRQRRLQRRRAPAANDNDSGAVPGLKLPLAA